MIVALCDVTEVSSDDKYDASMTLTNAIRARPSASVDSFHNERVTPPLAESLRREMKITKKKHSGVPLYQEAGCLIGAGGSVSAWTRRRGGEARVITHHVAPGISLSPTV